MTMAMGIKLKPGGDKRGTGGMVIKVTRFARRIGGYGA
jgi:hypothetical protein